MLARRPVAAPALVTSLVVAAMLAGLAPRAHIAQNALVRAGIGRRVRAGRSTRYELDEGEWIDRERWEHALTSVADEASSGAWYFIGTKIPAATGMARGRNVLEALRGLSAHYTASNRSTLARPPYVISLGRDGTIEVTATTRGPHVCVCDRGVLDSTVKPFGAFVEHAAGPCRAKGDPFCTYVVA